MLQRIQSVLEATCRKCYNVSRASWKLLAENVTTYPERLGSYLQKMLQRIKSVLEVTWRKCYNVSRTSWKLLAMLQRLGHADEATLLHPPKNPSQPLPTTHTICKSDNSPAPRGAPSPCFSITTTTSYFRCSPCLILPSPPLGRAANSTCVVVRRLTLSGVMDKAMDASNRWGSSGVAVLKPVSSGHQGVHWPLECLKCLFKTEDTWWPIYPPQPASFRWMDMRLVTESKTGRARLLALLVSS